MKLTAEEEAILAGRWGEAARRALEIATGEFFGAERMVRVTSAHLTGDSESMGEAGLAFVEDLVRQGARFVASLRSAWKSENGSLCRLRCYALESLEYERRTGVRIPLPMDVLNSLHIGREDWQTLWSE